MGWGSLIASVGAIPLAGHSGTLAGEHALDDDQGLFELFEPVGERAELEAERVVLELEPAGADAELGAASAHEVERRECLREQRRVPVGVSGHEGREANRLGVLSEC